MEESHCFRALYKAESGGILSGLSLPEKMKPHAFSNRRKNTINKIELVHAFQ